VIYIPPNTIHQHFNAAADKPVRLISAINRIYKYCGLNDLEQLEEPPSTMPDRARREAHRAVPQGKGRGTGVNRSPKASQLDEI